MTKLEPIKPEEEFQQLIEKETYSKERSLYNLKDSVISECNFKGKEEGESPLKECSNLVVEKCFFDLRYALWHLSQSKIWECEFSKNARAPFWYGNDIEILESKIEAVKALRETKNILIQNSEVISEEPFWNCKNILIVDSKLEGFYAFKDSKNIELNSVKYKGKYSFQYVKNVLIKDSELDTKDAFWHAQNVVVINSVIKGEYIGWYSKNLKFVNCTIESHQPFCYAKNIKFINCKMPNSDLAFENSSVRGNIVGKIDSIKNFKRGKLKVDEVGEIVVDQPISKLHGKVITK